MKINKETLRELEKLSKLDFPDKDREAILRDFKKILLFVNKLNEIDTKDILPLTHVHNSSNVFRDDYYHEFSNKSAILNNSPNHNSDYIKVPKIIN